MNSCTHDLLLRQAAALRDADHQITGELNDLRKRLIVGCLDPRLPNLRTAVLDRAQRRFHRDLVDLTLLFVNVARRG